MTESPDIATAFAMIEQAARMIALAQPAAHASGLRSAIDRSFYVNPTLAQRYLTQRADMERKLRILDDAARLLANWQIEQEATP